MKYIIMAGGNYRKWETPRHLTKVNGEPIIARTIRLLRENGIEDISISTNNPVFEQFGLPILKHNNHYDTFGYNDSDGQWVNCFYPTDEPTCYIFGDVIFTLSAIRTIVEYQTDKVMLFGSMPPFAKDYPKPYIEPFAFKAYDTDLLKWGVNEVKRLDSIGIFKRRPIAWELWSILNQSDPNNIIYNYVAINDSTCDIDTPDEIEKVIR